MEEARYAAAAVNARGRLEWSRSDVRMARLAAAVRSNQLAPLGPGGLSGEDGMREDGVIYPFKLDAAYMS